MNPVFWFEIPVLNLERAVAFYSKVFEIEFEITEIDGHPMALFPSDGDSPGCSGALAAGDSYVPSINGPRVYLEVEDAHAALARAVALGAEVLYAPKEVNPGVVVAEFTDSEGNRLAISQITR